MFFVCWLGLFFCVFDLQIDDLVAGLAGGGCVDSGWRSKNNGRAAGCDPAFVTLMCSGDTCRGQCGLEWGDAHGEGGTVRSASRAGHAGDAGRHPGVARLTQRKGNQGGQPSQASGQASQARQACQQKCVTLMT